MPKNTRRLGRGLSSLITPEPPQETDGTLDRHDSVELGPSAFLGVPPTNRLLMIPVDRIQRNPLQPRRHFDERALASLAASLKEKGALQPVVARPTSTGYELIAGERRLRAARLAGLAVIPVVLRSTPDDELLELALIENVHREDLNAIDRARAYRVLCEQRELSHEEIARRVGEDRATVTNYIRLLGLAPEVIERIEAGEVGVGHAKALLGLSDHKTQWSYCERAVKERWSVRRLETAIVDARRRDKPNRKAPTPIRPAVREMEERLTAALRTRVTIREGRRRHSGRLMIEYYSLEDFERITGSLGVEQEGTV